MFSDPTQGYALQEPDLLLLSSLPAWFLAWNIHRIRELERALFGVKSGDGVQSGRARPGIVIELPIYPNGSTVSCGTHKGSSES